LGSGCCDRFCFRVTGVGRQLRLWGSGSGDPDVGLWVWGSSCGAPGVGLWVWGSRFEAPSVGLRVWGSWCGAPGVGLRVWGSGCGVGCRVSGVLGRHASAPYRLPISSKLGMAPCQTIMVGSIVGAKMVRCPLSVSCSRTRNAVQATTPYMHYLVLCIYFGTCFKFKCLLQLGRRHPRASASTQNPHMHWRQNVTGKAGFRA
jgi:hypothetical protein